MAIFHGNAIPSAVLGDQVIAPSSNDWDYSFDGGGDWPVAGNSLGDHEDGAYIDNVGGDSALSSLITFDGDFDIEFTATGVDNSAFGIHEIAEDSKRATDQRPMYQASTESWHYIEASSGAGTESHYYGNTLVDGHTYAAGSVIKIERRSGVITFYDDGVIAHAYSQTSTNPVRFITSAGGTPFNQDFDNIKFTDTEKVQRDGFFNEAIGIDRGWGGSAGERYYGFRFVATRSGYVTNVKGDLVGGFASSFDSNTKLYSDNGTNPDSLIGTASDTLTLTGSGTKNWTHSATDGVVKKGTTYWIIFSDLDGTGGANFETIGNYGDPFGSGKAASIGAIVDHATHGDLKCEVTINTSAGEPTPDHDTLLLIQDEGIDGNTDFTDSSQLNLACTPNNQVHWDNVQTLGYGTTSIYVDGSDDHVSLVDHDRWDFSGDFTIEMILRCTDVSIKRQIIEHRTSGSASGHGWSLQIDTAGVLQFYANASGGAAAVVCAAISNDINYHVCAVRSNNVLGLALDGTWGSTGTLSGTVNNISTTLKIGMGVTTQADFVGWMKRIRISNVARWAPGTNFTSPSGLYPTA